MTIHDLIPLLQTSIGPVILVSAVGLLLLTMNNRLAHAIDRVRNLSKEADKTAMPQKARIMAQMDVLWRRTRLLRHSIELACMSALFAAMLVIGLFVTAILGFESAWKVIAFLFITSLMFLIGSLLFLILDVNKSLVALKLELKGKDLDESSGA